MEAAVRRTLRARVICGVLALAMGAVPLAVNWPYLFGASGEDRISAWLSTAAGIITMGAGIYLLAGPRTRGRANVLTREGWRYWYAGGVLTVCLALLVGALFLDQPTSSTGVPALLVVGPLLQLFVSQDEARR